MRVFFEYEGFEGDLNISKLSEKELLCLSNLKCVFGQKRGEKCSLRQIHNRLWLKIRVVR